MNTHSNKPQTASTFVVLGTIGGLALLYCLSMTVFALAFSSAI